MKDNLMNLFSFNSPLIVGKGQTIQYNIQMINLGNKNPDIHTVLYVFQNPPAEIVNYVTPLIGNGISTGRYIDVNVFYQ